MKLVDTKNLSDYFKVKEDERGKFVFRKKETNELMFLCLCKQGPVRVTGWSVISEDPLSVSESFLVHHSKTRKCHFHILNGKMVVAP